MLTMDQREKVVDLKLKLIQILKEDFDKVVFKRGGPMGQELVQDEMTLKEVRLYTGAKICMVRGTPQK